MKSTLIIKKNGGEYVDCVKLVILAEKEQTNLSIWWDLELISFKLVSPICLWAVEESQQCN